MLTTLLIRLPVWPVQSPLADALAERGHVVEHLVDLCHDVDAVDDERRVRRHAQGDVQDRSVLRDVDVLARGTSRRAARATPDSSASRTSRRIVSSVTRFFE